MTLAILVMAGLFLYPFVVYPAILQAFRKLWLRSPAEFREVDGHPSLALVICALNEERIIGEKMANCMALEYPRNKLRIVVVSDGSTDGTAGIVKRFADRFEDCGIELIERKQRRGKIANLNAVLPALVEEIVVLSDANVLYDSTVLLKLAARFDDPTVGAVSGKVVLTDTTAQLDASTGSYYSLEWFLQEEASAIYSMIGADGAMYALRQGLFRPCPDDTIVEDLVIPMAIVRQGKRVVFEPGAVGWEKGVGSLQEEYRRRVRIAAGAMQGLLRGNAWPQRAPLRFWFLFVSHKLLRWFSPITGAVTLLLCLLSPAATIPGVILASTAMMVVLAGLYWLAGLRLAVLSAPFYFLFGQIALGMGLLKGMTGRQTVLWAKVNR